MKILCWAAGLILASAHVSAFPQVNADSYSGLSIDEMSYLGRLYQNAFSDVYLDREHGSFKFSAGDLDLVTKAVTTSPETIVGIEYLESLCIYFLETEREDLDVDKLVSYLVDGSKQGEIVKFRFMKDTYKALTDSGKRIVDERVQVASFDSAESLVKEIEIPSVDDSFQHFFRIRPDDLINQYDNVCNSNRIEELRSRISDPENVIRYRPLHFLNQFKNRGLSS